jgi:hypothetical protein
MKWRAVVLGAALGVAGFAPPGPPPQEVCAEKPSSCEPGYRYVEEVGYREVERAVCKVVPVKRAKWVYCSKPDYFCLPACPLLGKWCRDECDACQPCEACKGPYCRQQLLKKKVEWECGTKCEVEVVKEKVPCTVWRKVPCGPAEPAPATPARAPVPPGSAPPR